MPAPILATKLYLPVPRSGLVSRPRLVAHLNEGLAAWRKLTLLSASAGFGKTTLLSEWIVALTQAVLPALQTPQPPPAESLLTSLLNEIAATSQPFLLVLDDYHSLDSKEVDQLLAFLLEHQPPQLHLIIASREDPDLPLARLRARGQLAELRAADLRFTTAEVADFLNGAWD